MTALFNFFRSHQQVSLDLDSLEYWIGWIGGMAVLLVLVFIFMGIWHGLRQPAGVTAGRFPGFLHSSIFYAASSLIFFGVCTLLWKPLPISLSTTSRAAALLVGSLLFFGGLALTVWARLTLGKNYFVSTSFGVQLFAGHQLITSGPFFWVRHPMYLGLILVNFGGLLIYRTWTELILSIGFLGLVLRAQKEEQALSIAFGPAWLEYCQRTPAWLPRFIRNKRDPRSHTFDSVRKQ